MAGVTQDDSKRRGAGASMTASDLLAAIQRVAGWFLDYDLAVNHGGSMNLVSLPSDKKTEHDTFLSHLDGVGITHVGLPVLVVMDALRRNHLLSGGHIIFGKAAAQWKAYEALLWKFNMEWIERRLVLDPHLFDRYLNAITFDSMFDDDTNEMWKRVPVLSRDYTRFDLLLSKKFYMEGGTGVSALAVNSNKRVHTMAFRPVVNTRDEIRDEVVMRRMAFEASIRDWASTVQASALSVACQYVTEVTLEPVLSDIRNRNQKTLSLFDETFPDTKSACILAGKAFHRYLSPIDHTARLKEVVTAYHTQLHTEIGKCPASGTAKLIRAIASTALENLEKTSSTLDYRRSGDVQSPRWLLERSFAGWCGFKVAEAFEENASVSTVNLQACMGRDDIHRTSMASKLSPLLKSQLHWHEYCKSGYLNSKQRYTDSKTAKAAIDAYTRVFSDCVADDLVVNKRKILTSIIEFVDHNSGASSSSTSLWATFTRGGGSSSGDQMDTMVKTKVLEILTTGGGGLLTPNLTKMEKVLLEDNYWNYIQIDDVKAVRKLRLESFTNYLNDVFANSRALNSEVQNRALMVRSTPPTVTSEYARLNIKGSVFLLMTEQLAIVKDRLQVCTDRSLSSKTPLYEKAHSGVFRIEAAIASPERQLSLADTLDILAPMYGLVCFCDSIVQ